MKSEEWCKERLAISFLFSGDMVKSPQPVAADGVVSEIGAKMVVSKHYKKQTTPCEWSCLLAVWGCLQAAPACLFVAIYSFELSCFHVAQALGICLPIYLPLPRYTHYRHAQCTRIRVVTSCFVALKSCKNVFQQK